MYTEEQQKAMWSTKVYEECPLFLDFPTTEYPKEEKDLYAVAVTARNKCAEKEVYIRIKHKS